MAANLIVGLSIVVGRKPHASRKNEDLSPLLLDKSSKFSCVKIWAATVARQPMQLEDAVDLVVTKCREVNEKVISESLSRYPGYKDEIATEALYVPDEHRAVARVFIEILRQPKQ